MNLITKSIAAAIRGDVETILSRYDVSPEATDADAQIDAACVILAAKAVALVSQEAARLADMRDPEKPANWMFPRDKVAAIMRGIPNDPPNEY